MNYKKRDDELIKLNKRVQDMKNSATNKSLSSQKSGTYGSTRKEVPYVKPNKASEMSTPGNVTTKPSTRYQNQTAGQTAPKKQRDTRYDKEFDEFHKYRLGDFSGAMDYDPVTDTSTEHWRTMKNDLMKKHGWSEKEFDNKWNKYNDERNKKASEQEVQTAVKTGKDNALLGTALQAMYTPQTWIEGGASMLSNLLPEKYKAQSADAANFTGIRTKEATKQAVKDEHIKGDGLLAKAGRGAYDVGTSLADMALASGVPVLGAATMGAETAARTNMEALERGASANRAAATAGISGLVSGAMNKIGLDKAAGAEAKTALGKVIKGAGVEAAENMLEDSANLAVDTLINTDKSQLAALHDYYTSQGLDDKSAWNRVMLDTARDMAVSGVSGAAFGGVMNGLHNLPSLIPEVRDLTKGLKMNDVGGVDAPALLEEARSAMKAPAKVTGESAPTNIEPTADTQPINTADEIKDYHDRRAALLSEIANTEQERTAAEYDALYRQIGDLDEEMIQKHPELFDADGNLKEEGTAEPIPEQPVNTPTNVKSNTNIHSEDGKLLNNIKIPEYTMGNDVYFNGSDDDIVRAETQDRAIVDTFRNIINDPEFNALSFKNGNKEVFVSPATNGNGLRMSYTIDGVPTGHHDYSFDQIDDLSNNLRNEVGNGGEDVKIQRKSDITKKQPVNNVPELTAEEQAELQNELAEEYDWTDNRVPEVTNEPPRNNVPPTTMPTGNVPSDEPPRTDKMGKSLVGTNTAVNSNVYTADQIDNDPVISELNKYAKANNDLTYNQAKDDVIKDGASLLDQYTSGSREIKSDLDVDRAMILLTDMAYKIQAGDQGLEAQRNLLFSRLRKAGTLYGQTIQAFKKWNNTPEGAIVNSENILDETTKRWEKQNKKQKELNGRIAKALEQMGTDSSVRNKQRTEKTHNQIKEGVRNVIEREFGSVEKYFNDNDIEYLTILAENKDIPIWQITDEIEHKMNFGDWYSLDESIEPKKPTNQRLMNALNSLIERDIVEKEPSTLDEIKEQVRNTFDKEIINRRETADFTDEDVDFFANLINEGATKEELAGFLDRKMATGKVGISADTQQKVSDLLGYANKFDPDSKKAIDLKSAAYKLLAEESVSDDATPWEKFDSWRYLAMLGNPKTMVRNYVGNKLFSAVTGVSNNLSAALEAGADKAYRAMGWEGIQRTKAFLNPVEDRSLIKAAAEDGDTHRYSELSGTKYEKGVKDAIKQQKSVFNSKLLRLYEAATDRGISDYNAVKKKYSTSLAGYMKANGLDESAFDADARYRDLKDKSRTQLLTDAEKTEMAMLKSVYDQMEKARDFAVKQAEYATFHEDNAFAQWMTKTSNSAPEPVRMVIEGLVPFKKTPTNILKSGAQYSPLGLVDSVAKTRKLVWENTGKRKGNLEDTYIKKNLRGKDVEVNKTTAADMLDSWSKTMTGTMLMGLGMWLKDKNIINSSNPDEKYQDELEGKQNYSITVNGKTYTLDWAAPAVMPLLMGAELSKIKDRLNSPDEKWYGNLDEILSTANALVDPLFETSMLQGIKNTFESAANDIKYDDKGWIGGILGSALFNTATGYLTQGIPTVSGQIARTVDNTRRSTDTLTDQSFLGSVEKQGRKVMNKIPGLSFLNNPYYDSYGRTQKNSPWNDPIRGLMYQSLSPAYIQNINTTAADQQARDVYNALGEPDAEGNRESIKDKEVFASWKSKVKEGDHKFTPDEMAIYRKSSGEAQYAIRDALSKEEWFKNLSGEQQTSILKKINTLVDKIGREEAGYPKDSKDLQAYQEGGIPALLNKWNAEESGKAVTAETGLSGNTNAVKEIKQAYADGDSKKAEELTEKYKKYNEDRLKLNEKYGVDITMAKYTEREDSNPGSNETWAKEHGTTTKPVTTTNTTKSNTTTPTNSNVSEQAIKDHQKYISRAGAQSQKYTNDIPKLDAMKFSSSEKYTYAYAINQDKSLTPEKFDAQYDKMDLDKNGSMKQDEMITYFNNNNVSQDQGQYLWKTYGENKGKAWKAVPVLSNGTWKKKKK